MSEKGDIHMKYRTSSEMRQLFLNFFAEKGHKIEPSSSLIPNNDPSLLWINSGVAALKKYFDGSEVPPARRIVNAQKSLRANDIENVGVTARHHTLFEMLGNFSIGDYFREEAMAFAWEFLTDEKWIGFAKEKLYVTVYPGDDETYKIWHEKLGLSPEHIVFCEDNFWEIGEGPCGPCTEIFYDRGAQFDGNTDKSELYVGGENDRYIEIWNIVFSQYNAISGVARDEYEELPAKNIDTGMGLERMVCILQDGQTNFETDLFLPIIHKIEELSKTNYFENKEEIKTIFKLIADHLRALVFAVADGALPSNEGRGYVIRRLLRRASLFAQRIGLKKPFMFQLVDTTIQTMQPYYDYLLEKQDLIVKIVLAEEEKFLTTLTDGAQKLAEIIEKTKEKTISGHDAFMLYDTYGFPLELTIEICAERGYEVNVEEFDTAMQKQKERARSARQNISSMHEQHEVLQNFMTPSAFIGYEQTMGIEIQPIYILKDDVSVLQLEEGEEGMVFFNQTPFYAESGGQVADVGIISSNTAIARVLNVKKAPHGQHMHQVKVMNGQIKINQPYEATVDQSLRKLTERNHTATHLLQLVLRKVLGTHIEQAGSSVDAQRLRFDFTHFEAISPIQLKDIMLQVNEYIYQGLSVHTKEMPIEDAKKLGAMALFGEKYGDIVRVVQAGESIEFCGGTHVSNTAEIGLFKIISESGIGSGVRRIEACTSKKAFELFMNIEMIAEQAKEVFKKKKIEELPQAAQQQLEQMQMLERKVSNFQEVALKAEILEQLEKQKTMNEKQFLIFSLSQANIQELKIAVDILKSLTTTYNALFYSYNEKQTNIVVATNQNDISAKKIIQSFNVEFGTKGGGSDKLAQATAKQQISELMFHDILKSYFKSSQNML